MALGLPIVTTNVGGNSELIENGKNGLTVPYNDKGQLGKAIKRLLKDEAYGRKISDNALKTINRFTKQAMIADLLKVFGSV